MKPFLLVFLLFGLMGLSHGLAQDSPSVKMIDEVVVTAHKYPGKASQTGKVLVVINREQLEKHGGRDLSQVLSEVTGMYISGANSNPGKDKSIFLRGARIDHTLITIDGMPQYDPSGIGGNFDIRNIAIELVERIEILKGSQSTLYGSDAIAGVINIITRKDIRNKFQWKGSVLYGSNQTHREHMLLSGTQGPIEWHTGYVRSGSKGIDETVRTMRTNKEERDGYKQESIYGSLTWKAGKEWRIRPFFRASSLRGALDQGSFVDEWDYTYRQKNMQWGALADGKIGRSRFAFRYNNSNIDRRYIDDSVLTQNGFSHYSSGRYKGNEHFTELFSTIPLGHSIQWTSGVDLRLSQTDQQFVSLSQYGDYRSTYSKDSLRQQQWSVYSTMQIRVLEGWNIEAGGRLIRHSRYGQHRIFNIHSSYLLADRWKFFANVSTGFRTPSLYQLLSEYGNPLLKPEQALSKEAGLQYFSSNNRLQARITLFDRTVKDLVFFYFNPGTFRSQYINQDKQREHGVEMESTVPITEKISLKAGYMYVRGTLYTVQDGKDTSYSSLLRRPMHSANSDAGFQVSEKLYLSTGIQFVGTREDVYFDNNTYETVQVQLKAYGLWNAYASYQLTPHMHLFTDLRNITNTRYTEISGFSTLGFNGYAGFRWNW